MWQTFRCLWLALSGNTPPRPAPRRRPAFRRPSSRPRLEALEDRCVPSAAGTLDTSFGSGGIVTTSFGKKSSDGAFAVAVQSDGKIVEAGVSDAQSNSLGVARYNPNGTPDSTFGSGDKVQTQFANVSSQGGGLVLQPDGKILVGNTVNGAFELVRYNANGTLDKTFNGTGMVSTAFTANGATLYGVALESVNGTTEIVAAGNTALSTGYDGFALARYNLSGSLDTSFGSGGKVVTNLGYAADIYGLAIQGDGQIVVAGTSAPQPNSAFFTVARYGTSGNLDPAFGNGGVANTSSANYSRAGAVVIQPDGKIVVGGATPSSSGPVTWALERLNSNGSVDTTFGTSGIQMGPFGGASGAGHVRGLAIQANGKLVAFGDSSSPVTYWDLARYNPDGSLDTTFGTGGKVTTTINGGGRAIAIAVQADGKIVVAGTANQPNNGYPEFALVRYWGDPVPPTIGSFTASPNPVTAGSNVTLTAGNVVDLNSGGTVTQVAFYVDSNGDGKLETGTDTLLGYGTLSGGTWTLTIPTTNWASATDTLFAQAEDIIGLFSNPFATTLTVQ